MQKSKIVKIILIVILTSGLLTLNQAISSTEDRLTEIEIFQFLNDVHHSLDLVAQKSGLTLDQRQTYFSSDSSSYLIGFTVGLLGLPAVAHGAYTAAKDGGFNSIAVVGTTVVGSIVVTALMFATPMLSVGSLSAAKIATSAGIRYGAISSLFAIIAGLTISKSKEGMPIVANIDEATYVNSHYRIQMHYSFYPFYKFTNGLESNIEGSCFLFFSIEIWSPGYVINYEIDSCDHNEIFPQNQPGWGLRTGEYVDFLDRIIGQSQVVTSGQVKIRQD